MLRFPLRHPNICCFAILVTQLFIKLLWLINIDQWLAHIIQLQYRAIDWGTSHCGSFSSCLRFWDVAFCPVHSAIFSHSCCCCVTCTLVDFSMPVMPIDHWWRVLSGWHLIWPSKAVLLGSVKSLHGILTEVQNFTKLSRTAILTHWLLDGTQPLSILNGMMVQISKANSV
jgi:hypothetical protein